MRKRTLFKHPKSFLGAAFTGRASYARFPGPFADAWKEAADLVVDEAIRRPRGQQDFFSPVVCYLYRHYAELTLKNGIRLASILTELSAEDLECEHSIARLLNRLNDLLTEIDHKPVPTACQDRLLELHKIDPDGQRFRYLTKKATRGGGHALEEGAYDFEGLKEEMNELAQELDGVVEYLYVCVDWHREASEEGFW